MTTKTGAKTWRNLLSKFLARLAKTFAFIVTVQSCQNENTTSVERSGPTFLHGFFLCLEKVDILTSWEVILDEILLLRLTLSRPGVPLVCHFRKFSYLGPPTSVLVNSKHVGPWYGLSGHVSQLLSHGVTIQYRCDSARDPMWDSLTSQI